MAIYNAVPPPPELAAQQQQQQQQQPPPPPQPSQGAHHQHTPSAASTVIVDVEAWTISALEALSVSPVARGTGTPLSIAIDEHAHHAATRASRISIAEGHPAAGMTPPRRPPSARDSQRKREMLLKGKEGSRQRRRWENGT